MIKYATLASVALAFGMIAGCDDRRTTTTEPQAAPAGGTVSPDVRTDPGMQTDTTTPGGAGAGTYNQQNNATTTPPADATPATPPANDGM